MATLFILLLLLVLSSSFELTPHGSAVATALLSTLLAIPQQLQPSNYDMFAGKYDSINGAAPAKVFGVEDLRRTAAKYVLGDVLETCIGTGLQSSYYDWGKIRSFMGIDSSSEMLKLADTRLSVMTKVPFTLLVEDAGDMNIPSGSFDTVIDTFSLCVCDRPGEVLREMARVLRADGRVILLENTRSDNAMIATFQDVTEPLVAPLSKDCRWNTDVEKLAMAAGLSSVSDVEKIDFGTLMLGVYKK